MNRLDWDVLPEGLCDRLLELYWRPMWARVAADPQLISVIPGFLLQAEQVIFYLGRTHVGIEYVGPERLSSLPIGDHVLRTSVFDCSASDETLIREVVGFDFDGRVAMQLPDYVQDLVAPTISGSEELNRLGWNWAAQDMTCFIGLGALEIPPGQFTRIVNARFFDASENGLTSRYVRWLDLIPVEFDPSDAAVDSFEFDLLPLVQRIELDSTTPYPLPSDTQIDRLQKVNRFVELLGDKTLSEPQITAALDEPEFRFIMKSRFAASGVLPQLICEWQSEEREAIQPDFFVVGTDGYASIVEFKLPELKGSAVVGRRNRETFSAEVSSYISQTRTYREYFDDPANRRYVKETYGFDTYKPRRILVLGRRWHFDREEWRSIAEEYSSLTLMTYDDLIDGVVAQLYG